MNRPLQYFVGNLILIGLTTLLICCKKDSKEITVTDIDGNVYKTVTIGKQVWMAENLHTTRYRNGDSIPEVTDSATWLQLQSGAYCVNPHTSSSLMRCGYLYNWYSVTDPRGLAPEGWHVPSEAEWITLIEYLGGEEIAGGKIRESGTVHWKSPNKGATNESGFTALPEGGRGHWAFFFSFGHEAIWWSKTGNEENSLSALCAGTSFLSSTMHGSSNSKYIGFSVRLVKD